MKRVSLERFCQELSSAFSQVCEEELMEAEKGDDDPTDTAAIKGRSDGDEQDAL